MGKRFITIAATVVILVCVGTSVALNILSRPDEVDNGFATRQIEFATITYLETASSQTATAKAITPTPTPFYRLTF